MSNQDMLDERGNRTFYGEVWCHAACLSIAEGCPGWDEPTAFDSPAMVAVRDLQSRLDSALAGEAAALEEIADLRVEGRCGEQLDALRAKCRERGYWIGIAEERARWRDRVEAVRVELSTAAALYGEGGMPATGHALESARDAVLAILEGRRRGR